MYPFLTRCIIYFYATGREKLHGSFNIRKIIIHRQRIEFVDTLYPLKAFAYSHYDKVNVPFQKHSCSVRTNTFG